MKGKENIKQLLKGSKEFELMPRWINTIYISQQSESPSYSTFNPPLKLIRTESAKSLH